MSDRLFDANRVKEQMAAFLRQPISKLEDGAVLSDLVVESFVLVEMVIELQEQFKIRLVQEDLKNVKTVGQLTKLFEERTSKGGKS
jgi:acyl carrier protein